MSNQHLLDAEDRLVTDMGKAFLCDRVVLRGKDLHHDLGGMDWLQFYLFSITGREFSDPQLKLLHFFWVSTSFPDPSIWPNHVAALAGSVRTTPGLSLMAGQVLTEATVYGGRPLRKCLDFFLRLGDALDCGEDLETFVEHELAERQTIFGYGRPLANLDERIPHLLVRADELGFGQGRYLQSALAVYRYLNKSRGLSMNVAALYSALAADMSFSLEDFQLFMFLIVYGGIAPCYLDARRRPEGAFFPMRTSSLHYQGKSVRAWE